MKFDEALGLPKQNLTTTLKMIGSLSHFFWLRRT